MVTAPTPDTYFFFGNGRTGFGDTGGLVVVMGYGGIAGLFFTGYSGCDGVFGLTGGGRGRGPGPVFFFVIGVSFLVSWLVGWLVG